MSHLVVAPLNTTFSAKHLHKIWWRCQAIDCGWRETKPRMPRRGTIRSIVVMTRRGRQPGTDSLRSSGDFSAALWTGESLPGPNHEQLPRARLGEAGSARNGFLKR